MEKSSIAISTCHGLNGVIQMMNQSYVIEPLEDSNDNYHIVYNPDNISRRKRSTRCGMDNEIHNIPLKSIGSDYSPRSYPKNRRKRNVYSDMKYIELLMVVDNRLAGQFNYDNQLIQNYVIQVIKSNALSVFH